MPDIPSWKKQLSLDDLIEQIDLNKPEDADTVADWALELRFFKFQVKRILKEMKRKLDS